jgi:uncharacterized membrane protein YphA (DoxX/SURF4 family)
LAIVALRFVVGAHFFHEGYTKWRDPKPFSAPVFAAAKGPFADYYHGLVWDADGLSRLDEATTFRIWGVSFPEKKDKPEFTGGGYLAHATRHFGFGEDEANKAAGMVMTRVGQYRAALEQWEPEIREYHYGLERREDNAADPSRKLASLKKHDARIATELTPKRMPWQSEIDKIWLGLEHDINDLADRTHVGGNSDRRLSSRGYLKLTERPGQGWFDTSMLDRYVPYFDMTIGVLLVLGLLTRVAGSLAAAFLATIIVSQWPFSPDSIPTGYQQVEMCSLLVLATIGAGKYGGLDAFLCGCCSWCCRKPSGGSESASTNGGRTPAAAESEKKQLVSK